MGMPYRALPCSQSVQIMASVYVWIIDTVKGLLFWQLHVGLGVGLFDIDSSHLNGIHFKGAQMYREVGNMLFYTEISVCSDEVWVRFSASFCAMTETPEDWKARETTSRYHFPRHDITCRYDICHEYAGNSKERLDEGTGSSSQGNATKFL